MDKKSYEIKMEVTKVCEIVEGIKSKPLIEGCHLYKRYKSFPNITIGEAVAKELNEGCGYGRDPKNRPAIALLEVILAKRTNYANFAEGRIEDLEKRTNLNTIGDLKSIVNSMDKDSFFKYWNYSHEGKYMILKEMLKSIEELRMRYKFAKSDYEVLNTWARNVDIQNLKEDVFGRIHDVNIATVQHLRMNFGIDTVKPDLRVGQVLDREFSIKTKHKYEIVKYVESISKMTGYKVLELDQFFVNYGSGYYLEDVHSDVVEKRKDTYKNNEAKARNQISIDKEIQTSRNNLNNKKAIQDLIDLPIGKTFSYENYIEFNHKNLNDSKSISIKLSEFLFESTKRINKKIMNESNLSSVNNEIILIKREPTVFNINFSDYEKKRNGYKNIMTIWFNETSLGIIITGKMKVKITFKSIEELNRYNIMDMINWKLQVMHGIIHK